MSSTQVKILKSLHEEVKDLVDNSDRYSSYKSFYEDAVREKIDKEKNLEYDKDIEEIVDERMEERFG